MSTGLRRVGAVAALVLGAGLTVVALPAEAATAPSVTGIAPRAGGTAGGTRVAVSGAHFTHVTAVLFGASRGTSIHVVSSTKLLVTAPAHTAARRNVRVVTAYGTSPMRAADVYTFIAPPTVSFVSPAAGATSGGTRVTVRGSRFSHVRAVKFGGSSGRSVTVVSSTELRVTTPKHAAGLVNVRVTSAYGTSRTTTSDRYTYTTKKVIFSDNFAGTTLNPVWTKVIRHGEYAQQETECNTAAQVAVANGLTITTIRKDTSCGDVRHSATTWPYATGDIQWKTLDFTYGTVSYRAKYPPQNTHTWPAIWLLGKNCQASNRVTGDTSWLTCPQVQTSNYTEIDLTECYAAHWCQLALSQPGSFPTHIYPKATDANWHTYTFTWKPSSISLAVDGTTQASFTAAAGYKIPSTPMFLIIQTQTGGVGGTPTNLPATLQFSHVTVTQP